MSARFIAAMLHEPASRAAPSPAEQPSPPQGPPDRRRAGRPEVANPQLIKLLRNPVSRSGRLRVAMYDAPGFLLPTAPHGPPTRPGVARTALALVACSTMSLVLFKAMLMYWG
jgi:hypothetical protein